MVKTICGSDEPDLYPERSSTRLSTSGHASYKGRSRTVVNLTWLLTEEAK